MLTTAMPWALHQATSTTSKPVAAMAMSFSFGSCRSVSDRSGTLLVIATVASASRRNSSSGEVTGYSCQVCSNAGRRMLALSVERSRKTMRCVMRASRISSVNRTGRMGRVELLLAAHFLARHRIVRAPVLRGRSHAAPGSHLDANIEHRHLGAGKGAHEHQLVEIPEVADAEEL